MARRNRSTLGALAALTLALAATPAFAEGFGRRRIFHRHCTQILSASHS